MHHYRHTLRLRSINIYCTRTIPQQILFKLSSFQRLLFLVCRSYKCLLCLQVSFESDVLFLFRARPPKYVCKIIITVIWIVSLVFAIPTAIALRVVQVEEYRICKYIVHIFNMSPNRYKKLRRIFYHFSS